MTDRVSRNHVIAAHAQRLIRARPVRSMTTALARSARFKPNFKHHPRRLGRAIRKPAIRPREVLRFAEVALDHLVALADFLARLLRGVPDLEQVIVQVARTATDPSPYPTLPASSR